MDPEIDGKPGVAVGRSPDVEIQAVLTALYPSENRKALKWLGSEGRCFADALPGLRGLRSPPPQVADGRGGVWQAFPGDSRQ